jgi:hypothetical protein
VPPRAQLGHLDRLRAAGKRPKVVIAAVMRTRLLLAWAILRSGQPYSPTHRAATTALVADRTLDRLDRATRYLHIFSSPRTVEEDVLREATLACPTQATVIEEVDDPTGWEANPSHG